jgi:hypothetical protein
MTTLQGFDRPMCCSTGVCGPKVDPVLPRFAADLEWLKSHGVRVERFNLAQEPALFTAYAHVKNLLHTEKIDSLPIVRVGGQVVSKGVYPTREQLAAWCGLEPAQPLPVTEHRCCSRTGCC